MQLKYVLLTLWIVLVIVWLLNHFYYQNQKREIEYRRAKLAKKE